MKRDILRIDKHVLAIDGTLDYVKSDIVEPGQLWVIEDYSYENESGARGTFRLYIESIAGKHYLTELQGPGLAELIYDHHEIRLREGEQLVLRQASCTIGDKLSLYASGYILFKGEPTQAED
jgi:hypothetical protein